jgi:bacteriocin-like protein
MTNVEKIEKIAEAAEFSKKLSDDDLEQISGGAFNPAMVSQYGLDVKTGKSGAQGLLS